MKKFWTQLMTAMTMNYGQYAMIALIYQAVMPVAWVVALYLNWQFTLAVSAVLIALTFLWVWDNWKFAIVEMQERTTAGLPLFTGRLWSTILIYYAVCSACVAAVIVYSLLL